MKKVNNNYIISKGTWKLFQPLILPKNYNLLLEPGTNIYFSKDSYIYIDNGNLFSIGNSNRIKLLPLENYWKGIFVKNSISKNGTLTLLQNPSTKYLIEN